MKHPSMVAMLATMSAVLPSIALAQPADIASRQWHRRILLVTAPGAEDPDVRQQQQILSHWTKEAGDRDLDLVEVVGGKVSGSSDGAAALVRRYRLSTKGFQAVLIGKDGHVALRSAQPISAATLQGTIDAMPMRRSGER